MKVKMEEPSALLYPTPVVLLTCINSNKEANIITLAWVGVAASDPPMIGVGIRPSRYSHELISETKEFVINIPTEELLQESDWIGRVSGRNHDKFSEAKLTPEPASIVQSPLIKECPVNLECKLYQVVPCGSHDLFLGEVVATHIEKDVLDSDKRVDFYQANPFVFNRGEYWSLGKMLKFMSFTKPKPEEEETKE
ncbi:MAG: flavin reductase family protein [Candidatus Ranarchaeia archaeon]|jgi:flavin reductase (DIM6/NTAB) family NADH-FMN oxidoreductase RutF